MSPCCPVAVVAYCPSCCRAVLRSCCFVAVVLRFLAFLMDALFVSLPSCCLAAVVRPLWMSCLRWGGMVAIIAVVSPHGCHIASLLLCSHATCAHPCCGVTSSPSRHVAAVVFFYLGAPVLLLPGCCCCWDAVAVAVMPPLSVVFWTAVWRVLFAGGWFSCCLRSRGGHRIWPAGNYWYTALVALWCAAIAAARGLDPRMMTVLLWYSLPRGFGSAGNARCAVLCRCRASSPGWFRCGGGAVWGCRGGFVLPHCLVPAMLPSGCCAPAVAVSRAGAWLACCRAPTGWLCH